MAVGLGRMLGFEFPKNFDAPYRADSITDVWRRWHISLSAVLRDYLYLPLGGNRKGPTGTHVNLAVVMLLGGLWHGAKWNFIVWGAYHGLLLCYERWRGKQSLYQSFPHSLRIGLTFVLMLLSWVLFRADNLTAAWRYYGSMFGLMPVADTAPLLAAEIYTPSRVLVLLICGLLVFQPLQAHDWALRPVDWPRVAVALPLFILALMTMYSQAFNPFLYFQF
jgi:alginate O-acetyltransferase complex protein AlgI